MVCYTVNCSPPVERLGCPSAPQGVLPLLADHSRPMPLLTRAAEAGFVGITTLCLDRLLIERGVRGKFRNTLAKVIALLRNIIPDISDQRIHDILLKRIPAVDRKPLDSSLVPGGVLEPSDK